MNGRVVFGILITLLIVAGAVGAGIYVYNLGVAQGLADSGKLVTPATGVPPYPYFYRPFGYRPFGGFGFLSCLVPLFVIFILFGVMRIVFWRARWGGMHHRHWEGGVPPMAEEWHRKMHEQQQQTTQK